MLILFLFLRVRDSDKVDKHHGPTVSCNKL